MEHSLHEGLSVENLATELQRFDIPKEPVKILQGNNILYYCFVKIIPTYEFAMELKIFEY